MAAKPKFEGINQILVPYLLFELAVDMDDLVAMRSEVKQLIEKLKEIDESEENSQLYQELLISVIGSAMVIFSEEQDFFVDVQHPKKKADMLKARRRVTNKVSKNLNQYFSLLNPQGLTFDDGADGFIEDDLFYDEVSEPYVRENPKVGRNDPCPCGSGKKYKKCCGKN